MAKILTTQRQLRATRHANGVFFRCWQCKTVKPVQSTGGTGYAYNKADRPICYECCGLNDRTAMIRDGRATLYLVKQDGKNRVTNWPNSLSFPATVRRGFHNMARYRYDAWFTGPDGFVWHGVTIGDNTQICHCKRTREKANA